MTQVKMTVNGKPASGEVEGRTLLVQFLRDDLELTGTHVGCDTSQCGACVVHVNGNAVKACTMFAIEADGAEVDTIEGQAAPDGTLNTIQQAFQDHHGLQCGFCTPGMVMSAAALLKDNPKPSEAEVRHYLDGNICRCTGYHNIVKAIMAASGQDVSALAAE
ncbi:MAG: (2Fe-2S)-binding protein [Sulfitobacter sp.]|jgi:carbon-monoxide dehydrogenase small subunit|uniref:(2Fe-2S)-binding protein n=1 Tax=unclassified Sulfitobacter TaxID=196795 RepID=UPI0007C20007|nr:MULTISPECIES: (2Fe-2S)-binding protein [unclassified Sulfitobacter]KZX92587.1 carbon monoxide dehydrogenase [Sulfitobacter sp. HI0021]KZY01549.1 carbon monoxide dehydrogenase [Sulfitobacter sp. HI0027]KZZ02760.1 carbon monoxide dehydrogenase [Sulfitobacter sp. HI0076]MAP14971.1 (2Fe-2S)-binding protein [Sulfitobacter sp.]MBD82269.1 (2Fe-2S)-binding protein [Sulfitobacter sp.]|tara:strand:+ start:982 stop:1467 length:486 start_codon:yes stop_codon:yes gene_type:complete